LNKNVQIGLFYSRLIAISYRVSYGLSAAPVPIYSGGITAGQFGAKPHLKFKIFSQFSVAFKKYFFKNF
jgi:hypothetical protein